MGAILRTIGLAFLFALSSATLLPQSPAERSPAFEVASVKRVPPRICVGCLVEHGSGGPGTDDPGMFRCGNCFLIEIIRQAFELKRYQFNPPPWMGQDEYQFMAKLPAGADVHQFHVMLQNLLKERFKLAFHFEEKELDGLALVVVKGGAKLKESSTTYTPPPLPDNAKIILDKNGYPMLNHPGRAGLDGRVRWRFENQSMRDFAHSLGDDYDLPVTDATGLMGTYDLDLFFVASGRRSTISDRDGVSSLDVDSGPGLQEALQAQLGLKLDPRKVKASIFVLDHIEKNPTDN
jgi:uncharacterized protein (TIGR03435 family)